MVGARTIRATLPGAAVDGARALPGVTHADRRGEAVVLACSDSDAAVRALLAAYPEARDIEISGAGLEEAFLQLTGETRTTSEEAAVNHAAYVRFELLRTFRNRRFFIFSLGFPLVLYFLIAGAEPERARLREQRPLGAALLHGRRSPPSATMSAMLSQRRAHRRRARRSAGTASSGSRRSRRAPTSAPRSSPAT